VKARLKIDYFMRKLNLPEYDFLYKDDGEIRYVMDVFRKRYVLLTPEEEVRQRFARYLVEEKEYPPSLMMTEYALKLNTMIRRCDILVHKPAGKPALLVECKAPEIQINQAAFDQVARYNLVFNVKYLMLTNGLKHYCCFVNFDTQKVSFLKEIPLYAGL
jgi:hypothetical protein